MKKQQKDQLKIIFFFALSSMPRKKKNVAAEENQNSGLDLNNAEKQKLIDFIRDDYK